MSSAEIHAFTQSFLAFTISHEFNEGFDRWVDIDSFILKEDESGIVDVGPAEIPYYDVENETTG